MAEDDLRTRYERLRGDVTRLTSENDVLRGLLARLTLAQSEPCHYCGAAEILKCPSGFPGCALADDLLLGQDEAFAAWAKRTQDTRRGSG